MRAEDILDVVHGGNSLLGVRLLKVADETKAAAPARVAVFDNNLQPRSAREGRSQGGAHRIALMRSAVQCSAVHSQPPRRHQTPQTSGGGWPPRCARQDRWESIVSGWYARAKDTVGQYPMKSFDMVTVGVGYVTARTNKKVRSASRLEVGCLAGCRKRWWGR